MFTFNCFFHFSNKGQLLKPSNAHAALVLYRVCKERRWTRRESFSVNFEILNVVNMSKLKWSIFFKVGGWKAFFRSDYAWPSSIKQMCSKFLFFFLSCWINEAKALRWSTSSNWFWFRMTFIKSLIMTIEMVIVI